MHKLDPNKIIAKFSIDDDNEKNNTITTGTSVTTTTSVTLDSAGYSSNTITIEPLGDKKYLYLFKNKKGITTAQLEKDGHYYLNIEGYKFQLKGRPLSNLFFRTPRQQTIEKWISGEYKIKTIQEIFQDLVTFYRTLFDLMNSSDAVILALHTLETWLRDYLNGFFYVPIDARKGAGKTTLLEVMSLLSKHGVTAGDITAPFLARSIERQKLAIFVDELDELSQDQKKEIESILRKGYRKGNPYLRVNPKTFEPERFEVCNAHAFSFRTSVEDALLDRGLPIRLRVSKDQRLPILNYHKENLTYPLFEQLFFYFFENGRKINNDSFIASDLEGNLSYASYQVTLVTPNQGGGSIKNIRNQLFSLFTKNFSEKEIKLLFDLTGRNIELTYTCLILVHILNLDVFTDLEKAIKNKQQEESVPDSFYLSKLIEFLISLKEEKSAEWTLTKGDFEGCFYYPKNIIFMEFITMLKENNIPTIGTKKFNGLLKELGFIEGFNWKNQKDSKGKSVKCLIFDSSVYRNINNNNEQNASENDAISQERERENSQTSNLELIGKDSDFLNTPISYEELAKKMGFEPNDKLFLTQIKKLKESGFLYEPRKGLLMKV